MMMVQFLSPITIRDSYAAGKRRATTMHDADVRSISMMDGMREVYGAILTFVCFQQQRPTRHPLQRSREMDCSGLRYQISSDCCRNCFPMEGVAIVCAVDLLLCDFLISTGANNACSVPETSVASYSWTFCASLINKINKKRIRKTAVTVRRRSSALATCSSSH